MLLKKLWRKLSRRTKRESFLEEHYVQKTFALNLDTDILNHNLQMLENKVKNSYHPYNLSRTDAEFISKRLREKYEMIREGYNDGQHGEYMDIARRFLELSETFNKKYKRKFFPTKPKTIWRHLPKEYRKKLGTVA